MISNILIVLAQTSTKYTDPDTGIIFQRFLTTQFGGFSFGITLPTSPTNEFIGQIVRAPLSIIPQNICTKISP